MTEPYRPPPASVPQPYVEPSKTPTGEMRVIVADTKAHRVNKRTPLWAAITIGVVASAAPALLIALPSPWNAVVCSALLGLSGSLATFFGMRSSGAKS